MRTCAKDTLKTGSEGRSTFTSFKEGYMSRQRQKRLKRKLYQQKQCPMEAKGSMNSKLNCANPVQLNATLLPRTQCEKYFSPGKEMFSKLTNLHLRLGLDLNIPGIAVVNHSTPTYNVRNKETINQPHPLKRNMRFSLSSTESDSRSDNEVAGLMTKRSKRCSDIERDLTSSPEVVDLYAVSEGGLKSCYSHRTVNVRTSDSDVLCVGSSPAAVHYIKSASSEASSGSVVNIVSGSEAPEANDHFNEDVDSDSSELPEIEIPVLEPMPVCVDISQLKSLSPVTTEQRVAERGAEGETAVSERSRHSSEDGGEVSLIEDPTVACWCAFTSAPVHCKAADQSVRRHRNDPGHSVGSPHRVSSFRRDKHHMITGCHEEGFTDAAIDLVNKFTTSVFKPMPGCLWSVLHQMLSKGKTSSEAKLVYRCLKNVQHLHHPSMSDLRIEWTDIRTVAERLINTLAKCHSEEKLTTCRQWHSDLLTLRFIVAVLEDDVERKSRWNTLKKKSSLAFTLLHPDNCRHECKEVICWIHRVVTRETASHRKGIPPTTCGCDEGLCHRNYVLPLFEKLLELSLVLTDSWNYKGYILRQAEAINDLGLRGLPQMQLIFETLKHDFLCLKLSELVFNSHFESDIYENTSRSIALSVSQIVNHYFFYVPRVAIDDEHDALDDSDEESASHKEKRRTDHLCHLRERVEEMLYILVIMLKSYIRCARADANSKGMSKKSLAPGSSSTVKRQVDARLTGEDRICLLQMGDHVDRLRKHIKPLCQGRLCIGAEMCLTQMSLLYEWSS